MTPPSAVVVPQMRWLGLSRFVRRDRCFALIQCVMSAHQDAKKAAFQKASGKRLKSAENLFRSVLASHII